MGLFSKKEKDRCPICGEEMGFFKSIAIADGMICENCEKMVRGQFDIEEYYKQKRFTDGLDREDYSLESSDPLKLMTIDEVKEMIAQKKQQSETLVSELGNEFANMARVENYFSIAPKPLDVGLKRSKELKNKIVAVCLVVSGEFSKGDVVTVRTSGIDTETKLLDVRECSSSSTFETVLSANLGKHSASAGVSAWIILDMTEGIEEGTIIGY